METYTEVRIFSKPKKVYNAIARELIKLTQSSQQDVFDIALSGGNTPKEFFKKLSQKYAEEIPWERIHFWWGDERCVAPDDEQSNYKMTVDYLLSKINIPEQNIHRIRGEAEPEEEAIRYSRELEKTLNSRGKDPVFDVIILGLGGCEALRRHLENKKHPILLVTCLFALSMFFFMKPFEKVVFEATGFYPKQLAEKADALTSMFRSKTEAPFGFSLVEAKPTRS